MFTLFKFLCISLVTYSFIKNSNNWIENIFITTVFVLPFWKFLYTVDKYQSVEGFIAGNPLCSNSILNNTNVCIHYDALFVYLIGQILWGYYAMPIFSNFGYTNFKAWFYYVLHSLPLIAILCGYVNDWNFYIQLITDINLIIIAIIENDFELFIWFRCCQKKEQFDRSNFNHVMDNIYQNRIFEESDSGDWEEWR